MKKVSQYHDFFDMFKNVHVRNTNIDLLVFEIKVAKMENGSKWYGTVNKCVALWFCISFKPFV